MCGPMVIFCFAFNTDHLDLVELAKVNRVLLLLRAMIFGSPVAVISP